MQTVMLAVICVSCVLLSPQVDAEARTLQVGKLAMACFLQHQALMQPELPGLCPVRTKHSLTLSHRAGTGIAQRSVLGTLPC